jgi:hypothetical protein
LPIFSLIDPSKAVSRSNIVNPPQSATPSRPVASPSIPIVAEPLTHRPTVKRVAGREAYSTPSILDALRDEPKTGYKSANPEVTTNQDSGNETIHPFTQQELLVSWKLFVDGIDDAPQLKSALSMREPILTNTWKIDYELDTELQLNRLALDLKPKLQGYLRNHFRNEAIEIQFKVSDCKDSKSNIPYTDAERWCSLVEKYPALATLKSKFGLDFEHF